MGRDVHNSRRDTGATRNLSLALIDTRAARILITVLLFALALAFLYAARHTFIAFLFAIFFAYLVDPAVSRIERWVHGRGRAIAIIYLLLVGVLITFFVFVGPRLGHQAARLGETLPGLSPNTSLSQIADKIGMEHGWSPRTREQLKAFLARYGNDVTRIAQRAVVRVAEAAQNIWLLFLIPILAVFFLQDGRSFSETALSMVQTRPQREFLQGVLNDLNQMLAHFIRAQLTLALLSLVAYISFLSALRVPYARISGTSGGAIEFIPVLGPLVADLLIIVVALLSSYSHWLVLLLFLAGWRLLQDYVVAPRIMGEKMELHPLAAIFGVLAGGEIAGVLGVYLSIPAMASLRILFRRWRIYVEKRRFGPLNDYAFGTEITPRK